MSNTAPRQRLRLDPGWRFHLGDIDAPLANKHIAAYMANKAGYARGAARGNYDDSDWRLVDLPHDWSVEGPFSPENHLDAGYLPRGIGWYRRYFTLDESDRGKSLAIQFDGVATHCTVYVNGHLLHRNFCGYMPFTIDISDVAHFGDQLNNIAVRVDATYPEGWWYEGAGIYRHVWLIKAAKQHFATDGVFVRPERQTTNSWLTHVESTITNNSDEPISARLVARLIDPDLIEGACAESGVELPPRSRSVVRQRLPISNPKLWSLESRNLYDVRTQLLMGDAVVDEQTTRFGYRTIRFDSEKGFFLNDQHIRLYGTCNHQDHAGVGVAVPDSIHRFRIQRLKEMGCNAYRCAHNPPAPEILDACDELGMLVMDENRNFGSSPEHLSQLRLMVQRDRNHPSVILWSICNEEAIQGTPIARKIAQTMLAEVKKLDPSRPVMAAISGGILNDDCLADAVEVMGINYQPHLHEPFHQKHPTIPIIAAETHCALGTRGVYTTDARKQVFDSYDSSAAPWGQTARDTWRAIRDRDYIAGLFIWTGFDYRGEPSPHEWPSVSSHWGIMDLCGFAKDSFFLHKAWFTAEPFVHILPHWNWTDGETIRVAIYTNCPRVELMLNGKSLGCRPVDPVEMLQWPLAYEPGKLLAIGYRGDEAAASDCVATAGAAVALGIESLMSSFPPSHGGKLYSPDELPADGEFAVPVSVFAIDADGRRVPTADNAVSFSMDGPGKIIGVGNGDPNCHEPDKAMSRSLFNGLAQVIVQTNTTPGEIILSAHGEGLRPAGLRLKTIETITRPTIPPATVRHFISDWRMSPIASQRPDPQVQPSDSDMNTWERINPANGLQRAWENARGYAIYRATAKVPQIVRSTGGAIVFQKVGGQVQVFVDSNLVHSGPLAMQRLEIPLEPGGSASRALVVLVGCEQPEQSAGIAGPVEIVPV